MGRARALRVKGVVFSALLVALSIQAAAGAPVQDPFAFFRPGIEVTDDERRQLDRGTPVVRVLPATGREIAVFAAIRVNVDAARLIAWLHQIPALKKSRYVLAIGRFSDPPRIEDLADLVLDDDELSDLRRCRIGHCKLKLAAAEMDVVRRAADQAGDDWKPAVQHAFREVVLSRVHVYLAGGRAALPAYEDDETVWTAPIAAALLEHSPFLTGQVPTFADHLARYPNAAASGVESFVYWSKERQADKAVVSATHVSILRGAGGTQPDVVTAGQQILATHYMNASLGVTVLLRGAGMQNYLVYVNRTDLDVLGGPFGGLVRWFVRRRVAAEATNVLNQLRRRIEAGPPPPLDGKVSSMNSAAEQISTQAVITGRNGAHRATAGPGARSGWTPWTQWNNY